VTELVLTRGLPSSGKTTWARAWVADDEVNRVRVNRDDLRNNFYGRYFPVPERQVTIAQHAAVRALLAAGISVVVDDTNLRARYARDYADMAAALNVEFWVNDIRTPVDTCIRWDAQRAGRGERSVGADVIRGMNQRYRDRPVIAAEVPAAELQYVPDFGLQPGWLVDLDGTLARNVTGRGWFDWDRVAEDELNVAVATLVLSLRATGRIVIVSGRDESCLAKTAQWLVDNGIVYDRLYMRPAGDMRKDAIVKRELFAEITKRYRILGAVDDRQQVVDMWRSLGLLCLQVAPGDF
jgi:predicted kinase